MDYMSLPPQFFILGALRKRHFLLGLVCAMALLSNVLSISLSALFLENNVVVRSPLEMSRPYQMRFKALNGSDVPFTKKGKNFVDDKSGTLEPFYALISNSTAKTPFPAWSDSEYFYQPFLPVQNTTNSTWTYQAKTPAVTANLKCQSAQLANFAIYGRAVPDPTTSNASRVDITALINDGQSDIKCIPTQSYDGDDFRLTGVPLSHSAFEWNTALTSIANSSTADALTCRGHVLSTWVRANLTFGESTSFNVTNFKASTVTCKPELSLGIADVIVTSDGHVVRRIGFEPQIVDQQSLFDTSAADLFGQVHQFIVDRGLTWHNDQLPSDFENYLLTKVLNDSQFLDAGTPPPTGEDFMLALQNQYKSLFNILLSQNKERLFQPVGNGTALPQLNGAGNSAFVLQTETRIFMSRTMFILTSVILILSICVTFALYLRRPWKILARMPTSILSIVAFFAASHAVEDLKNTGSLKNKQRTALLKSLGNQYGFGTFLGTDGKAHIGIEKDPYLVGLTKTNTGLSWRSNANVIDEAETKSRWRKNLDFEPSRIKEGGWL
jgi:hypothetical protein